jgi:aconitate hydratase
MKIQSRDSLGVKKELKIGGKTYHYFNLQEAASKLGFDIKKLPYSMRVVLENTLRMEDGENNTQKTLLAYTGWVKDKTSQEEVGFMPSRVLMQDFTGVPAIVDLAAMRDAMKSLGGDPLKINPLIPVDLVIDHSVQVDFSGTKDSLKKNVDIEMERNLQRYAFLRWGQKAFDNFRVVPPGAGICHQVNIEFLAQVVCEKDGFLYPDTVIGTDSHTTMVNGLSVLGWGVGGIEAEAAMLGQTSPMILPDVVGVRLKGALPEGATATDLVLTLTNILRAHGVVNKFVEYFGPGLAYLSLANRATIANMAPEYGATCGFFPIDDETLKYLRLTGRDESHVKIVEEYAKAQHLWRSEEEAEYTDVLELDLSSIEPSLAGPKRPQDRVSLKNVATEFGKFTATLEKGEDTPIVKNGDVVIAAITSCTNTSNPYVLIAAGLLAKKAVELGLVKKPWVKASLAPGSQVVTEYLAKSGLQEYLDKLGFNVVGYGCTTCIGNSGPLAPAIDKAVVDNKLLVASVISGNRNFEGRIHPLVKANYLGSPPLVVAYAIAGNMNINVATDPMGHVNGKDIFLKDIWPSDHEISNVVNASVSSDMFREKYSNVFEGDANWQSIKIPDSDTYEWDPKNTYINNPPYFVDIKNHTNSGGDIIDAKILAIFGDSITTDHISPAGNISKNGPAAKYLMEHGVEQADFNSYGARRGNHEVMMRGTFANVRIKNELCPGTEGGVTKYWGNGDPISIFDSAMRYKKEGFSTVIIGGKEYGTGSSRDWAAKGPKLLGVKAVIVENFERIHRSNLVGMGVLPLTFTKGMTRTDLKLDGTETVTIHGLDNLSPRKIVTATINSKRGNITLDLTLQVFTEIEVKYLLNGGILQTVLYNINE